MKALSTLALARLANALEVSLESRSVDGIVVKSGAKHTKILLADWRFICAQITCTWSGSVIGGFTHNVAHLIDLLRVEFARNRFT